MSADERRGLLYVGWAALLFSTSPVLVRWAAASLTAYEITAGRMLIAALLVLGAAAWRRHSLPPGQDWPRFALYGLITALHFGLYIASLNYTTIAHSLALVYTAPVFVALFSRIYLQERLTPRTALGIGVVVAGVVVLTGFEPLLDRRMLWGDLLALGSSVTFALYSVAGRSQRQRYPLLAYAGSVYGAAALWLLPAAALTGFTPGGYTPAVLVSILLLGALPLGLGHTLYNAALRKVSATSVNLIATQEVTGGILLGILFLGEIPSLQSLIGVLITLLGIMLVIL